MSLFTKDRYREALDSTDATQTVVQTPDQERLNGVDIICLVLNRTIGSGIFVAPAYVLKDTGSVGASLLLWGFGGIVALCGLLVWAELATSTPRMPVEDELERRSVPRNGGEKNYLEYIYSKPKFLMTCIFGMMFLTLGNLAGNAIAFGSYIMKAAGQVTGTDESIQTKGGIIGVALGALTIVCILHVTSRRGGILVNNAFAILKILLLVAIIVLGVLRACGVHLGGDEPAALENFTNAFQHEYRNAACYANALLYVLFAYSGYEQPFYLLAECSSPRRRFPIYTVFAECVAIILFLGVNIAFFLVVPKDVSLASTTDLASLFLVRVFGSSSHAQTAMESLIAVSIFGNLVVMTFTAARVKQEIGKEGILPFSLFWATGHTTPWARFRASRKRRSGPKAGGNVYELGSMRPGQTGLQEDEFPEQSPMAALLLHWISSVVLIAVTAALTSQQAYDVLTSLYSYVLVLLVGALVSGGLLYLWFAPGRWGKWKAKAGFRAWGLSPAPAIIYFATCVFALITSFIKPTISVDTTVSYKIVPAIGISSLLWGTIYWAGLQLYQRFINEDLIVERTPFIDSDPDTPNEYVLKADVVEHKWYPRAMQTQQYSDDDE